MKTAATARISTPSEREIVITRVFDAPRALVFEAWTRAEHVTHWWDPSGARLAACEIDLRPNGRFRFVNSGAGGAGHAFTGIYREIEPPGRLVFTTRVPPSAPESVGTLLFEERDGRTTLTMTIACQSASDRDALLAMRVDQGTARTLDNLDGYLGRAAGTVVSRDGTAIAYDRSGLGAAVILVDGALCRRGLGPSVELAKLLASRFTVFTYDRRGRNASDDRAPYALEREVEDIAALLHEAGGSAYVWGMSSGAVLALEAAQQLPGIEKVAVYEAPLIVDDSRPTTEKDWARIDDAILADKRGAAVKLFLRMVGVPGFVVALMRLTPMWPKLKAIAHTLPYDGTLVKDYQRGRPLPEKRWASVTVPVLVMDGARSPDWMRHGNRALARALPTAQYRTLDGQTHALKPEALVPTLVDFFQTSHAG
jgi:uncharacterized protein YndB with AHSA1/START domain/pimeloyl-ACP methyl ester carboxylesterase